MSDFMYYTGQAANMGWGVIQGARLKYKHMQCWDAIPPMFHPVVRDLRLEDRETDLLPEHAVICDYFNDTYPGWYRIQINTAYVHWTLDQLQRFADSHSAKFGAEYNKVRLNENGMYEIVWHDTEPGSPLDTYRTSAAHHYPTPLSEFHPVCVGRTTTEDVFIDFSSAPHVAQQGQSGSGKSVLLYSTLAQLSRIDPNLCSIWINDPHRITGLPFQDRPGSRVVLGIDDEASVQMLEDLVQEMDERLELLSSERLENLKPDNLAKVGKTLIVAAFDEFPGIVRAMAINDGTRKPQEKLEKKFRGLYGRILSEGRKVGISTITVAQRFDADLIGGYERAQMAVRVSLGLDNATAINMLHELERDLESRELVTRVTQFSKGRCLFQSRERTSERLSEVQVDDLPYEDYLAVVDAMNAHYNPTPSSNPASSSFVPFDTTTLANQFQDLP